MKHYFGQRHLPNINREHVKVIFYIHPNFSIYFPCCHLSQETHLFVFKSWLSVDQLSLTYVECFKRKKLFLHAALLEQTEAPKKKPSKSLYAKATDTGVDPKVAAKRLNIDWDSAADIDEFDVNDEAEVPSAVVGF